MVALTCRSISQIGIIPHAFWVVDARIQCTFSRLIGVVPGDENSDFNLNASYYIIIGTGGNTGSCLQDS